MVCRVHCDQLNLSGASLQVRYRRDHLSGRTLQHFPLLDDLLKDVCDGAALLAVIHFYCPELIRLEGTVPHPQKTKQYQCKFFYLECSYM